MEASWHHSALDVLLVDGPLLAVNKPAGLLTQGASPPIPSLESQVREWIRATYQKPGNVYLGIPHRLDRPVSGVVIFARNSKAAARLAEEFRERRVRKIYWALLTQPPARPAGRLDDWLIKHPDEARAEVVAREATGARHARLEYRILPSDEALAAGLAAGWLEQNTPVEIVLETGRMHQIRVQFASRGCPVLGDAEYGSQRPFSTAIESHVRDQPIALHARSLTVAHPIRYEAVTIVAPLPALWTDGPPLPHLDRV